MLTGPIENGSRPNAFGAPAFDIAAHGYAIAEYFFDGEATAYAPAPGSELASDGRWEVRASRTAPFKTRMLVFRPEDPTRSSGTVWLSWLNVTSGFEVVDVLPESLRDGDALVFVSAQRVGLDGFVGAEANGLRAWDPERYGSLSHPGDDFSYDIFTKAARLVGRDRSAQDVDPMDGLAVERVIASGISQSAIRLTSYLNGVHLLERAVDAALLVVNFGWFAHFEVPADEVETDVSFGGSSAGSPCCCSRPRRRPCRCTRSASPRPIRSARGRSRVAPTRAAKAESLRTSWSCSSGTDSSSRSGTTVSPARFLPTCSSTRSGG
jgi:Alpha/beta hydrolase domain